MNSLDELTPEEQELLVQATPEDWKEAIAELAVDPSFWSEIATSFVDGLAGRR